MYGSCTKSGRHDDTDDIYKLINLKVNADVLPKIAMARLITSQQFIQIEEQFLPRKKIN